MKLSSVVLARVIGFFDTSDLNPRGKAFFPHIVPLVISRFNFQKYPIKAEDFDEDKGVVFETGHSGSSTIDKITVWSNGIGVDLRSSTSEAKDLLESTLIWLADQTDLIYEPGMIKRWGYLSGLTFESAFDLDNLNPAISLLAQRVSDSVRNKQGANLHYQTFGITITFDKTYAQSPLAHFSIQRRRDTPFSQNKYFSEGPLPTDAHIALLEEFEKSMTRK